MSEAAFYRQLDATTFAATEATAGPWQPDAQHGGPPSALLTRAIEQCRPVAGMHLARVSVDFLGPVPTAAELTVRAEVVRPGRRVQLVEARMEHGGRPVMAARGWRIAGADPAALDATAAGTADPIPPPLPAQSVPEEGAGGFIAALEWRWVRGHFREPGPATAWARLRVQVVAGEAPSPWQRAMCLADSGNGISGLAPFERLLFINPELTVHLVRPPAGEWLCMDAVTRIAPGGSGLATSRLFDADGLVGHGAQALLVEARP